MKNRESFTLTEEEGITLLTKGIPKFQIISNKIVSSQRISGKQFKIIIKRKSDNKFFSDYYYDKFSVYYLKWKPFFVQVFPKYKKELIYE